MKKTKKKQNAEEKQLPIYKNIILGNFISIEFLMRHWIKICTVLFMVVIYIATKYQCMTKMEEVRRLESYLEVVKSERIRERSVYMSRIRESAMQSLADSIHPGLRVQEQPPFTITLDPQN